MSLMHKRIRLVCLLILVLLLLAGIGVAYGRYSSVIRDTLTFQAQKSDPDRAIAICSDSGWRTTAGGAAITFTVESGAADQRATLRLTATEGFPASATVTLTVGDTDYVGVPQTIDVGHPLYDKMGVGAEYRFYTADGECVWAVSDTTTYTLTVEGEADASLLRLTATEA